MESIGPTQLSEWFERYAAVLVLFARHWLDADLAEDVVQDIFIRLSAQQTAPGHIRAWLFRAVRNAALSQLRSQGRRARHEERRAVRQPDWFEIRPDDLIDARTAQVAMASLPPEESEVVVLRIWAGMTFGEIADIVGQSVSTVFKRYQAALAGIRRRLELTCRTKND
jgi:RNA polymerase sigma-70 factor (ECF subfamily)